MKPNSKFIDLPLFAKDNDGLYRCEDWEKIANDPQLADSYFIRVSDLIALLKQRNYNLS
jgi:hypothetical protein